MNFQSCLEKQNRLKESFSSHQTPEDRYSKIIELGRSLPPYPAENETPEHLVKGCQSLLYLKSTYENGIIYFTAASDALISAGLASLLLSIYSGETPEAILKCPPTVLTELHITNYLSQNRANGLRSLYLKMQQDALKALSLPHTQ